MMDLKSKLKKEVEKAVLKEAAGKILPMDGAAKLPLGGKAKLAGGLAALGTIIALLSQYLAG